MKLNVKKILSLNKVVVFNSCLMILFFVFQANVLSQHNINDNDITNAIEKEMWLDQAVNANTINVSTADGIVTFTGTVDNILAKDRAVKIAESTKGVLAVINRIKVEPMPNRSDSDIRESVESALINDPATETFKISVNVNKGVVTLTGSVDSWTEKLLCTDVSKGVRGVKDIKNDISVNYKTTRPDLEIKNDIEGRLANDVRVDDNLIKVNVNNGDVTLTGSVGSLREKIRAKLDSWVIGVKSVNNDNLEVKWWARDEMRRKNFISRTDKEIKKAVEDAFFYDPRIFSFNIGIDVNMGTVTLTGIVNNLEAKKSAAQDAHNTMGVWRVVNLLKVRPKVIPSDDVLEKRVTNALVNNPYVDIYEITVSAAHGIVYLSGNVNTSFEKQQAEQTSETVKGVTNVINTIKYDYRWTWKPDREIKADIEDQLNWDTYIDNNNIKVTVNNGIATLNGEVYSWSGFEDAERNAYQGGAKDVINDLKVRNRFYGPYNPLYKYWDGPFY